jgi:hypothetical protein
MFTATWNFLLMLVTEKSVACGCVLSRTATELHRHNPRAICYGSHVTCGLHFLAPCPRSIFFQLSNCIFAKYTLNQLHCIQTWQHSLCNLQRRFPSAMFLTQFLLRANVQNFLPEFCQISTALLYHFTALRYKYTIIQSKSHFKNYILLSIIGTFIIILWLFWICITRLAV